MAAALPDAARAACRRVCLNWRRWAPGERCAPTPSRLLTRGHSNLSVLLRGEKGAWVLRVGAEPSPLGVCREREAAIHRRAAAAGLAPAVRFADPAAGLLVTDFLESDTPQAAALTRPGTRRAAAPRRGSDLEDLAAIAGLLRNIHCLRATPVDGTVFGPELNSAERLHHWRKTLAAADPLLQPGATADGLHDAVQRVLRTQAAPLPCHNDLLDANRIAHGGRLYAIDWEYACLGDPFFDLAAVASELDESQQELLLRCYLSRTPESDDRQRLADQMLIYAAIAVCWYAAQALP